MRGPHGDFPHIDGLPASEDCRATAGAGRRDRSTRNETDSPASKSSRATCRLGGRVEEIDVRDSGSLGPARRGGGRRERTQTNPISASGGVARPRGLSSSMSGDRSQSRTFPCTSRVASRRPSRETAMPTTVGFVSPELRELAVGLPPEVVPGETAGVVRRRARAGCRGGCPGPARIVGRPAPGGRAAGSPHNGADRPDAGAPRRFASVSRPPGLSRSARAIWISSCRLCRSSQLAHQARPPTSPPASRTTRPIRAAMAGRRRAQPRARSTAETGRPTIGRPSRNRCRSSRSAPAEAYRRAGSLRRHLRQIVSRSRGSPGRSVTGRDRLGFEHQSQGLRVGLAAKRRPTGQDLVEGRAQGVDVGRRDRPRRDGPRPARGPCNGACPAGLRSASRRQPPRRAWPGRSRSGGG